MVTILFRIALDVVVAASAVGLYLFCIWPQLLARRARWPAFVIAGAISMVVPFGVALANQTGFPDLIVPLGLTLLLVVWFWPDLLVRVTGGRRPLTAELEPVFSGVARAGEAFEVGDLEAARSEMANIERWRTPNTARYIDLWQRFIDEEASRRSGARQSSRQTTAEIQAEAARLRTDGHQPGVLQISVLLALAAIIAGAPASWGARACVGVEMLLLQEGDRGATPSGSLAAVLLTEPEAGATILADEAMDLDAAEESRHDPDTRAQLVSSGFIEAQRRVWRAADGRQITSDVFDFRDADGALSYHRAVNRHACQYSNEAFKGLRDGIGLQVRYSHGDPIVEQMSFLVGKRRFVVAISALRPPPNHDRLRRLAEQQLDHALH